MSLFAQKESRSGKDLGKMFAEAIAPTKPKEEPEDIGEQVDMITETTDAAGLPLPMETSAAPKISKREAKRRAKQEILDKKKEMAAQKKDKAWIDNIPPNLPLINSLSPVSASFYRNKFGFGDNDGKGYFIFDYPGEPSVGWLSKITNIPNTLYSMYIEPAPKNLPIGTRVKIVDTNTDRDNKVHTVNDRGGAIKVLSNETYRFDILMATNAQCISWGRRSGKAVIMNGNGANSGNGHFVVVTGVNLDGTINVADPLTDKPYTCTKEELYEAANNKATCDGSLACGNLWVVNAPNYSNGGDGFGDMGDPSAAGFVSPLAKGTYGIGNDVGSKYGGNGYSGHTGQDLKAPAGTPIMSVADGTVISTRDYISGGKWYSYGRLTVIDHGNGWTTYYAHQSGRVSGLAVGEKVSQGQIIGYVGTTGNSTGNHLHFEIRKNKAILRPKLYINF